MSKKYLDNEKYGDKFSNKSNFWAKKKQKSKIIRDISVKQKSKELNTKDEVISNDDLIKDNGINELDNNQIELEGIVISNLGNYFEVQETQNNFTKLTDIIYTCKVSGSVHSENEISNRDANILVVGDKVKFLKIESKNDEITYEGVVKTILLRTKLISRKAAGRKKKEQILASNISKVIVFVAADSPPYNKRLIDRYLIAAEQNLLEAIIVINKVDLFPKRLFESDLKSYKDLGYKIFYISTLKPGRYKNEINTLKENLSDTNINGYTILSGPSGVGKSSFLNLFFDEDLQIVNEVSESSSKGIHTTSYSKLFLLDSEHGIIDSPGIREFGLWQFDKSDIRLYFHEFDKFSENCKFSGCTHDHEPDCAVKLAVEEEKIDYDRYTSYINILNSNPEDIY